MVAIYGSPAKPVVRLIDIDERDEVKMNVAVDVRVVALAFARWKRFWTERSRMQD